MERFNIQKSVQTVKEGLTELNKRKSQLLMIGLLGLANLVVGADYLATRQRLAIVEATQKADTYLIGSLIKNDVDNVGLMCTEAGKIMELESRPDALTPDDCSNIQEQQAEYWMQEITASEGGGQ